jgi:hypothetical protein
MIEMTPAQFRAVWEASGLSQADFALALGYQSDNRGRLRTQVNDMAHGRKPISPQVARLAEMFRRHGVPKDFVAPVTATAAS